MKILFLPQAEKSLEKFFKQDQLFIIKKILHLEKIKNPLIIKNIKKVKLFNFFRLRIINFRVFFEIKDNEILISEIRRRSEKTYR